MWLQDYFNAVQFTSENPYVADPYMPLMLSCRARQLIINNNNNNNNYYYNVTSQHVGQLQGRLEGLRALHLKL
jgi:hypothetical protein